MTEHWSEDRLEAALASVGDHLVVPDDPADRTDRTDRADRADRADLAEPALEARAPLRVSGAGSTWPVLRVAAALAVVLLALGMVVAPVREAVADWLGLGSTRIERVPEDDPRGDPTGLPSFETELTPASAAEIEAQLGGEALPNLDDSSLGRPDLLAVPPEGGLVALWDEGATSLWFVPVDDPADRVMQKYADFSDHVVRVEDLGEAALTLEGEHVLSTPDRRLGADNVVLWIDGDVELRLESDLDIDALLAIAHSIT